MNGTFETVHRRAAWLAWGVALAVMTLSLGGAWWFHHSRARSAPSLNGAKTPLASALAWPWADFPPTSETERVRIEGEFKLQEPLLAARVLPWTEIPEAAALRPTQAETLEALEGALALVRALPDPALDELSEDPLGLEQRIDQAIDALQIAKRKASSSQAASWLIDYDRGVLYLRRKNARAALRDLDAAKRTIDKRIQATPAGCGRGALYEASIHTRYALGHALLKIAADAAKDDPTAAATARNDALRALSWTLVDLYDVKDECPARYEGTASSLQVFPIAPTGLSSGALASDLIAGYLASPGFHRCTERPSAVTCSPLPRSLGNDCSYRDRSLCRSSLRSAAPFDRLFRRRFDRFYAGDEKAWQEENLLWALANAVDWTAENPAASLDDPYLLYNLGALLAQLGEFQPAASYLRQAQEMAGERGEMSAENSERLDRLAAATAVLAGTSPSVKSRPRAEPTLPRAIFRKLYPADKNLVLAGNVRPLEFRPVGDAFSPNAEAAIDDWLFLELWKRLLRQGEMAAFEHEYARALGEKGISRDFFTRWRRDAMTALGERALARAADLESREPQKSKLIRRYVADDPTFPDEIQKKARGGFLGEIASFLRRHGPLGIYLPLGLLALAAPLAARALVRAHRKAFASAYAAGRAKARVG